VKIKIPRRGGVLAVEAETDETTVDEVGALITITITLDGVLEMIINIDTSLTEIIRALIVVVSWLVLNH